MLGAETLSWLASRQSSPAPSPWLGVWEGMGRDVSGQGGGVAGKGMRQRAGERPREGGSL